MELITADKTRNNQTGGDEEYNSIAEAFEALKYESEWVIEDGQ